jgi:AbrB family looped-hinge helix DNA binding protein
MVRRIPADEINKELRNAKGWLDNDDPFFDTINSVIDERSKHVPLQSVITSKFRTTIPKEVRDRLNLSVYDTLEWKIYQGKILVQPVQKRFF